MARSRKDPSYDDPKLPQATVVIGLLLFVLAAGVYLIVSGLA